MSKDSTLLPPLAAEVQSFLEDEKKRPGLPAAVQHRLLERLRAEIGLASDGGGSDDPDQSQGGSEGGCTDGPPGDASLGDGPASALMPARALARGQLLRFFQPLALTAFSIGIVTGAGSYALLDALVDDPRPPSAPTAGPSPLGHPLPAPRGAPAEPRPAASALPKRTERTILPEKTRQDVRTKTVGPLRFRPRQPRLRGGTNLAEERRLIEIARTALLRGRNTTAIESLDRHRSLFPSGELTEEREALSIMALIKLHQKRSASSRAEMFRRRFPGSILLPAVESALEQLNE